MARATASPPRLPPPPASAAAPATRTAWALFDPSVITEDDAFVPAGPAATCATSDGHDVRVSLRLADPPAASFVEMRTDAELWDTPTVLAASDGDLLLIHAVVHPPLSHQEHNFFVYQAHPASPSLRLLPHPRGWDLYTGIVARRPDGEEQQQEEEFVAAAFHTEVIGAVWGEEESGEEVGKLTRFSSSTGKCEVLKLPIPFDPSKGLYKFTWATDKVVSFGDLMCFVDYHRGILLCDVFAVGSPELRFLPLPEIEVWDDTHDYCYGRGLPEEYRTVGVSQGAMRFVDVSDGLFGRRRNPFAVTITTWTLRTSPPEEMGWDKDAVLQLEDLWSFPRHDADVVQFALLDPKFTTDNAWVILVDVRKMELLAYMPYTNQAKEDVEEEDEVVGCLFHGTPLICSDLYNLHCSDTA